VNACVVYVNSYGVYVNSYRVHVNSYGVYMNSYGVCVNSYVLYVTLYGVYASIGEFQGSHASAQGQEQQCPNTIFPLFIRRKPEHDYHSHRSSHRYLTRGYAAGAEGAVGVTSFILRVEQSGFGRARISASIRVTRHSALLSTRVLHTSSQSYIQNALSLLVLVFSLLLEQKIMRKLGALLRLLVGMVG
jgi:hypothetical protein